jgi:hypothetical protein
MADSKVVEQDLNEFLFKADNIRREDRLRYLMTIFNKHLQQDQLKHVINHYDLHEIVSVAQQNAVNAAGKVVISGKEVSGHNPMHIGTVEAVIGYFNKHSLLKRAVGFEYSK